MDWLSAFATHTGWWFCVCFHTVPFTAEMIKQFMQNYLKKTAKLKVCLSSRFFFSNLMPSIFPNCRKIRGFLIANDKWSNDVRVEGNAQTCNETKGFCWLFKYPEWFCHENTIVKWSKWKRNFESFKCEVKLFALNIKHDATINININ